MYFRPSELHEWTSMYYIPGEIGKLRSKFAVYREHSGMSFYIVMK